MIEVKKLTKRFGPKVVLQGLDFQVDQGETVALLGPNGAGKTTFIRILASLSRPLTGLVRIAGYDLPAQAVEVRKRLGFVSHLPLLYGDLTAEENLTFFGRVYSIPNLEDRIQEIISLVGLERWKQDLVRTYSRGMQQRLAIARAVLHNPEVILFDEPHTGLDQDASTMLDRVLRDVAVRGRTILITSHDLGRVSGLAKRFDVLIRGKIAASINHTDLGNGNILDFYQQAIHMNTEGI